MADNTKYDGVDINTLAQKCADIAEARVEEGNLKGHILNEELYQKVKEAFTPEEHAYLTSIFIVRKINEYQNREIMDVLSKIFQRNG